MEGTWNVIYEGRTVGECTVVRCGLYYRFNCSCERVSDDISRLYLHCGGAFISLGVLIPLGDRIKLEKRMTASGLPMGKPEFYIETAGQTEGEPFIPVKEEKPFPYISRLKSAYFAVNGGMTGLILKF